MNLTGRWKGSYTYGEGYPFEIIGKSEPFEFDLMDNNGIISGSCIDNVVSAVEGNESYVVGSFKDNAIAFKKRYKIHFAIDEHGSYLIEDNVKYDGVDYTGRLRKTFFSRKPYFAGDWSINCEFKDEHNMTQVFVCRGTWEMRRFEV